MLNRFIKSKKTKKSISKKYLIIFLYILISIKFIYCSNTCKDYNNFNNNECFNNILIFNSKTYRAGHFAQNKDGDMIVEYSDNSPGKSRLFFGLKKSGKYYFTAENITKEIEIIDSDSDIYGRYESINLFVSFQDDINQENQYLFSTSSYMSLTELYNSNLNNLSYVIRKTSDFFGNVIFSYVFSILEVKTNNSIVYFCIYTHGSGEDGNNFTIKKFGFTSFSLTSFNEINSVTITNNGNNRIISSFLIEEDERFVVFFNKNDLKYAVNFYDYDLNTYGVNIDISDAVINTNEGCGIFFKSVYLGNKLGAFIYNLNGSGGTSLYLKIIELTKGDTYTLTTKIEKNIDNISFETYITLNDFLKMEENRLVFISTVTYTTLYILIFDFYNSYINMKIRIYYYDLANYKTVKEFSAFIYNNYLVFTSTVVTTSAETEYFSLFMMFGYPNGTDSNIDLSRYFIDIDGYDSKNNIITKLLEGLTIDNNIFGYIIVNQIKLVSIPNQILFYNSDDVNTPLTNGSILKENYSFSQNDELIKTDEYYSLDYQYIIQEPDYTTFYGNANNVINYPSDDYSDQSSNFNPKTFEGRTNTAKFKLCHEYCATCNTLGISNDDQKCLSCLPFFQYDYFNDYNSNCVPEGYFKDKENNNSIIKCNSTNSKFYFNITSNKTICFKSTYDCPDEYPYLNTTTNECQNSSYFNIIQTTNPSTIATSIPNENHIFTSSTTIENDTNEIEISNFIDNLTERAENQNLISTPHTNGTQQYTYSFLLNNDGYVFTDKSLIYDILKNEIIPDYPFEK